MGGGCNDAQAGKAPLSAAEVGGSFVLQYYRTLTTDRDNLYKYYKDESICSRGFEGCRPEQITYLQGVDEIRDDIQIPTAASRCEINSIQSQESKQGGVLVLVLGYFVYSDSAQGVHFTQVFFLEKETTPFSDYFVQNDILRYVTGKPEQSEVQALDLTAQAQTDLPPPRLPPPQPPMMVEPDLVEEAPVEEEPMEEVVEEEVPEEANEAAEDEGPVQQDTSAADDAAAAEAVAAAVAAEAAEAEEKPKSSWACMASKLKENGGQLGNAKVQGFALPAPAKAKPVLPPPSSVAAKAAAASSTTPVLPSPSTVTKAKPKAAAEDAGEVRLWLSRIPTESPAVENQELIDCLNKLIADAGFDGSVEIDAKRDMSKDWAYVTVASQDVADALVQNSKGKILVRGKGLKIEIEKQKSIPNRRGQNAGGKGGGGAEDGADSKGARRGKGGKSGTPGSDAGGKGGKGGPDAGSPSADGARSKGGARRGGEKGGGKDWRAQS